MEEETRAAFAGAGFDPTPEDWAFFDRLQTLVTETNRQMNLTRITGREEFLFKHVLDSILPFLLVPRLRELPGSLVAADLGSGGGFPGLVLARFHPSWRLYLIERTRKKARFLEEAARALGLANVKVVPRDAREAASAEPGLRRGCGLVVARAVGRIADVSSAAAPLLCPGGLLVHYKGGTIDEDEWTRAKVVCPGLRLDLQEPVVYPLPPDARRSAVVAVSRPSGRRRGGAHHPKRAR